MFVSKRKYLVLESIIEQAEAKNDYLNQQLERKEDDVEWCTSEINRLKAKCEEQENHIANQESVFSNQNCVKMVVADDLLEVFPHVTVKRDMFEKMVQMNMISDGVTVDAKPTAMQVVMMTIARDALNQIIESMEPATTSVD